MTDTPLRADAERNRQRLLDAARELFATRGLDVTLDEVARHAGVGTGTAYRRFPNKDALIDALMADRIGEIGAIARECLEEQPDPWLALVGFFERSLALQSADRGLKEVLFATGRGRERTAHARQQIAPWVTQIVQRAKEAGVVRDDMDTSDVPLINFMLTLVVDVGRDVEPDLWRRYLAIVLDGLRPQPDGAKLPVPALGIAAFQEAISHYPPRRG